MNIIVKALIKGNTNLKTVIGILSNNTQIDLFTYQEDEILINSFELEGKTVEQAKQIKRDKQIQFENTFQSSFEFGKNCTFSISGNTY